MRRFLLLASITLLLVACQQHPLEMARERLPLGTTREDAIEILNQQAWYHQPCPREDSFIDLFFFGSHEYEKADIVIVDSRLEDETYRIVSLSSFEPYAWHTAYKDCIQRDSFE